MSKAIYNFEDPDICLKLTYVLYGEAYLKLIEPESAYLGFPTYQTICIRCCQN